MKHSVLTITLACAALSYSHVASADPAAKVDAKSPGVQTLAPVKIRGRVLAPDAAIDVSRAQPKLTLAVLRRPFLARIESAICRDPF